MGNQGVKQLLDALENNYTLRILDPCTLLSLNDQSCSAWSFKDLTSNSVSRPGWSIAGRDQAGSVLLFLISPGR